MRPADDSAGTPASVLALIAGCACALLATFVLVSWLLDAPQVARIVPSLQPMNVNTALGLLACGAGLAAGALGWRRTGAALGAVAMLVGGATALQYASGLDFAIDDLLRAPPQHPGMVYPRRMSPNTSVGLLLIGAALVACGRARAGTTPAVLGALAVTVGASALIGYASALTRAYAWSDATRMAVPTATSCVALGLGLLALSWQRLRVERPDGFGALAWPVGLALAATSVVLSYAVSARESQAHEDALRAALQSTRSAVEIELGKAARGVQRMANRWSVDSSTSRVAWQSDASRMVEEEAGFVRVAIDDPSLGISWRAGTPPDALAGTVDTLIEQALQAPRPRRPEIAGAAQGPSGVALITLAAPSATSSGALVVVVLDATLLLDAVLQHAAPGYAIAIDAPGVQVYQRLDGESVGDLPAATTRIDVIGSPWTVSLRPTPELDAVEHSLLPEFMLVSGFVLSALVVVCIVFAARERATALALQDAHEKLRSSEERLTLAVEGTSDTIFDLDIASGEMFFTSRIEHILGYAPNSLPRRLSEFISHIHPDDLGRTMAAVTAHYERDTTYDAEYRLRRADGRYSWFQARGRVRRDQAGRPRRFTGALTWIDERKAAAAELEEARDAALAAARAKADFLAMMSHEIRTPMNGVLGMTSLLLDTPLDAVQRDYAETIRRSGDALLKIIDDILDFSKIESGKLSIDAVPFDVRDAVEDVVNLLAERAHEKGLQIAAPVDPAVPTTTVGDPGRLRQILLNLVGNAVKFTERGEVVVRVGVQWHGAGMHVLRFAVSDTGVGIRPDVQGRLFEAFTQAEAGTTRRFGGTGLGLAISRRLVELQRGDIGLQSTPGAGSTFWFTLPLADATDRPATVLPLLRGRRVLVVDAHEASFEHVGALLAVWGAQVERVTTADDALAACGRSAQPDAAYDVVLIDTATVGDAALVLPERLKAIAPALVTVFSTGTNQPLTRQALLTSGATGVIAKPVRRKELALALGLGSGRPTLPHRRDTGDAVPPGMRILLVEDNRVNRKLATALLGRHGCLVDAVADGRAAAEAARRTPYDLILMDCEMPEMNGYDATRAIRTDEARSGRRVPIVALTANALQGDAERCLDAGMDDYLSKPISHARLTETLLRWLGSEDAQRAEQRA